MYLKTTNYTWSKGSEYYDPSELWPFGTMPLYYALFGAMTLMLYSEQWPLGPTDSNRMQFINPIFLSLPFLSYIFLVLAFNSARFFPAWIPSKKWQKNTPHHVYEYNTYKGYAEKVQFSTSEDRINPRSVSERGLFQSSNTEWNW